MAPAIKMSAERSNRKMPRYPVAGWLDDKNHNGHNHVRGKNQRNVACGDYATYLPTCI
jgi:hypothetical protein